MKTDFTPEQIARLPQDKRSIYVEVDRLRAMACHFGVKESWTRDEVLDACGRIMDAIFEPTVITRTFPISETLNFQLERIARGKQMTVNQLIDHCLGSIVVLLAGTNEDKL